MEDALYKELKRYSKVNNELDDPDVIDMDDVIAEYDSSVDRDVPKGDGHETKKNASDKEADRVLA